MEDYLIKSLAFNNKIRAYAINATKLSIEVQKLHNMFDFSGEILSKTLMGTLFLSSSILSKEESMNVVLNTDSDMGRFIINSNYYGSINGYVINHQRSDHLVVGNNGFLSVSKDLNLKNVFTGIVPLVSDKVDEDFTYYLSISEQIASFIKLFVSVDNLGKIEKANGLMLQNMPYNDSENFINKITKSISKLYINNLLKNENLPEKILYGLFKKDDINILDKLFINYICNCSYSHFEKILETLPNKELKSMIIEDRGTEIICKFCGKKYFFNVSNLEKILNRKLNKEN